MSNITAFYAIENAKQSARKELEAQAVAKLVAENPKLARASENCRGYVAAAKNIRFELKARFPGIKFSVRSDSFSMGDSINISWTDGPNVEQVEAIADKYKSGNFNSMEDLYEYASNAWTDAFGSSKYISCNREYSDKMLSAVMGRVGRKYGFEADIQDYRQGRLWSRLGTDNSGRPLAELINPALYKHTYVI